MIVDESVGIAPPRISGPCRANVGIGAARVGLGPWEGPGGTGGDSVGEGAEHVK